MAGSTTLLKNKNVSFKFNESVNVKKLKKSFADTIGSL